MKVRAKITIIAAITVAIAGVVLVSLHSQNPRVRRLEHFNAHAIGEELRQLTSVREGLDAWLIDEPDALNSIIPDGGSVPATNLMNLMLSSKHAEIYVRWLDSGSYLMDLYGISPKIRKITSTV